MTPAASLAAALAMTPLLVAVIWRDVASLRIPNPLVLAVLGVFVVCGLWGLPLAVFAWALVAGAVVLALGIGLHALAGGRIGGGDLKLLAALAPFVAWRDLSGIALIWVIATVLGLLLHRLIRALARGRPTGWAALDQARMFPLGVVLGATMLVYLWWRAGSGV